MTIINTSAAIVQPTAGGRPNSINTPIVARQLMRHEKLGGDAPDGSMGKSPRPSSTAVQTPLGSLPSLLNTMWPSTPNPKTINDSTNVDASISDFITLSRNDGRLIYGANVAFP